MPVQVQFVEEKSVDLSIQQINQQKLHGAVLYVERHLKARRQGGPSSQQHVAQQQQQQAQAPQAPSSTNPPSNPSTPVRAAAAPNAQAAKAVPQSPQQPQPQQATQKAPAQQAAPQEQPQQQPAAPAQQQAQQPQPAAQGPQQQAQAPQQQPQQQQAAPAAAQQQAASPPAEQPLATSPAAASHTLFSYNMRGEQASQADANMGPQFASGGGFKSATPSPLTVPPAAISGTAQQLSPGANNMRSPGPQAGSQVAPAAGQSQILQQQGPTAGSQILQSPGGPAQSLGAALQSPSAQMYGGGGLLGGMGGGFGAGGILGGGGGGGLSSLAAAAAAQPGGAMSGQLLVPMLDLFSHLRNANSGADQVPSSPHSQQPLQPNGSGALGNGPDSGLFANGPASSGSLTDTGLANGNSGLLSSGSGLVQRGLGGLFASVAAPQSNPSQAMGNGGLLLSSDARTSSGLLMKSQVDGGGGAGAAAGQYGAPTPHSTTNSRSPRSSMSQGLQPPPSPQQAQQKGQQAQQGAQQPQQQAQQQQHQAGGLQSPGAGVAAAAAAGYSAAQQAGALMRQQSAQQAQQQQQQAQQQQQQQAQQQQQQGMGAGLATAAPGGMRLPRISIRNGLRLALGRLEELVTCPLTLEIMRDPVIAADGYTYERGAIQVRLGTG